MKSFYISVTCPTTEPVAQEAFSKMTAAAGKAIGAENAAKKSVGNVSEQEKILLERVADGLEMTVDGVKLYRDMVCKALKECKDAKASYQMYGTTCLTTIGLGSKLPLAKFEQKMSSDEKLKCKFCEKVYDRFDVMSDHMLYAHPDEIGITSVMEKWYKVRMFSCKSCKLEFNNDEARISHEPICSGDPSTRKCKKCQKIMSVRKYKNHRHCT